MIPTLQQSLGTRSAPAPLVLIAEDDVRVRELLQLAFVAEHFRVITAADGDEAIRLALAERPDLVVLEVQIPRKNGFEVCDWLRHDPEDPQVPIMLVSGSGDTDIRIEGLARGADDFLSKPFSPKELVARARRLVARSGEARAHRRRTAALERELGRAQEETRRAHRDLTHERRLRELAGGPARELLATLDPDELAGRILLAVRRQLGAGALVLLAEEAREHGGERALVPHAFLGADAATRFAALRLDPQGETATVLGALGRPMQRHELERRGGSRRDEMAGFVAAGAALLAPLRTGAGLEAVVVADERPDGAAYPAEDRDALAVLGDLAATAWRNARRFREAQDRALALLAERSDPRPRARLVAREAERVVDAVSAVLALPAREHALLRHVAAFGPWAWSGVGAAELVALERDDPTRRVRDLRALVAASETLDLDLAGAPGLRRTAQAASVCVRYGVGRLGGRSVDESARTALSWCGSVLDPDVAAAFTSAFTSLRGERGRAA